MLRLCPMVVLIIMDVITTWYFTGTMSLEVAGTRSFLGNAAQPAGVAGGLRMECCRRHSLRPRQREYLSMEISQRSIDDRSRSTLAAVERNRWSTTSTICCTGLMRRCRRSGGSSAMRTSAAYAACRAKLECELMLAGDLPDDIRERAERIKSRPT